MATSGATLQAGLIDHSASKRHTRDIVIGMRRGDGLRNGVIAAVLLLVVFNVAGPLHWLHNPLHNPFSAHDVRPTAPQPPLRLNLRDINQYDAASATYQVVIDVEHRISHIPAFLWSEKITFLAQGSVDALVDFSHVSGDRIRRSADGSTVTVLLPAVHLTAPNLDLRHTRILSRDRGLLNRIKDALSKPRSDQPLYLEAEGKVTDAARQDNLLVERARANTTKMVEGLLHVAGVKNVIIKYDEPTA